MFVLRCLISSSEQSQSFEQVSECHLISTDFGEKLQFQPFESQISQYNLNTSEHNPDCIQGRELRYETHAKIEVPK